MSLTGGPRLSTVPFKDLNSFSFDGVDDYIDTNSTYSELNGTTKATWSVWVKPTLGTTMVLSRVSSSTSTSDFVYQFPLLSTGEVFMQIGDTTRIARTGSNVLTNNVWSHILVCYDGTLANGSKTKIFINGVDSTSSDSTTATSLVNANYPLSIGRRDQTPTYYYEGIMDEVAIWSGTDLRNDAVTIYNSGVPNNLNDNGLTAPTTWFRVGDNAIWNGQTWIMPNSGTDTGIVRSINMVEDNRTTDVPPNPWVNTLSTSFDGVDDYVRVGTTSLGITTAISVSAWVKIPTTNTGGGGTNIQVIACEDTTSGGQRNWMMFWRGTGYNYFAFVVHHTNISVSSVVSTSVVPNDGQWHHLLGTYDGTTNANGLKLYIDGVLNVQGTAISTGINSFTSTEPTIGATTGGVNWKFEGNIDEVAIWDNDQSANVSAIGSTIPTDLSSYNPLSWWRMGDGSTYPTINDVIGSNDGTMTNMSSANFVTDVPTFSKKSISLDGVDDYVEIGSPTSIQNLTSEITISAWIKAPRTFATNYYTLASKGEYAAVGSQWSIQINTANARNTAGGTFSIFTNSNAITDNQGLTFPTPVDDNQWHHMMFVNDGTDLKVYIDGVLDATGTGKGRTLYNGNRPLRLGRLTVSTTQKLIGNLDEVAIFSTALGLSDAQTIYNGGVPNDISSLSPVSWWRCGDGDTSPTLTDNGSASNDGTMTNFTTFSTDVPN